MNNPVNPNDNRTRYNVGARAAIAVIAANAGIAALGAYALSAGDLGEGISPLTAAKAGASGALVVQALPCAYWVTDAEVRRVSDPIPCAGTPIWHLWAISAGAAINGTSVAAAVVASLTGWGILAVAAAIGAGTVVGCIRACARESEPLRQPDVEELPV